MTSTASRVASPSGDGSAVRVLFRQTFGREPDAVASAPGRVNLIGEHTDYNGGEVLPIALERRTWVALGLRAQGGQAELRAVSASEPTSGNVPLADARPSGEWWDYVLGVAAPMLGAAGGIPRRAASPSLDVAVTSDVPSGAGLSSSAALEVATAFGLASLLGHHPDGAEEAALAAWRAETSFVGVACGIMDQYASALGKAEQALHLDCATARYDYAPFADTVLIFDTAVRRALRESQFNRRRAECAEALRLLRMHWPALPSLAAATPEQVVEAALPPPLDRRALHVSLETRRVREAVAVLRAGQPLTAELLVGSHESLRDLYECSRPELDWVVEEAMKLEGIRGARMTGAGWGGCAIVVGDSDALRAAAMQLAREYEARFHLAPRTWTSRAGRGVYLEEQK